MTEAQLKAEGEGRYRLDGEMSFGSVSALLRSSGSLFSNSSEQLDIDLSGVTRADSAGLALLIEWVRRARQADKNIRFHHIPEQLMSIAKVGRLDTILPLAE